jgi:hypothetical protein
MASTAAAPAKADAASVSHSIELKEAGGVLTSALANIVRVVAPDNTFASMANEELFPIGERAAKSLKHDAAALNEIRQRFKNANGQPLMGYTGWLDFLAKNFDVTPRQIQRKLNEVNGKDTSKVNLTTGNMHTRVAVKVIEEPREPVRVIVNVPALDVPIVTDDDNALPKRWHSLEREEPNGCTLPDLRKRIDDVAKHFEDPYLFLGLTREHKVPTGATQREALKTRQTLDIPAQWKDLNGKVKATTNVQYANGQLLNRLTSAVEAGRTKPEPSPFVELAATQQETKPVWTREDEKRKNRSEPLESEAAVLSLAHKMIDAGYETLKAAGEDVSHLHAAKTLAKTKLEMGI